MCFVFFQDVLNNLGSSELDEDDLMLDLDLSDDQRHRHGNSSAPVHNICSIWSAFRTLYLQGDEMITPVHLKLYYVLWNI